MGVAMITRWFPDLASYTLDKLRSDAAAALAVTFMGVPQGIAYALIAGLPPATGLYAGAVPAIVGSMLRSSRHVVAGPTNALSLLVGGAVAASVTDDVVNAALLLALMVGIFQAVAGVLRLGAMVDFISSSVVLGYITGAGVLIGIGQLPNLTGTSGSRGDLLTQLSSWGAGLGDTHPVALALGLGTVAVLVLLKFVAPKAPGAIVVLVIGVVLSWALDFDGMGLKLARDIAPVPLGLPPLTIPDVSGMDQLQALLPLAVAATVLSLVESSAVGRSIASVTGQRLETSRDFLGQGLANVAAGLFGGYPTSGSLSRSALNHRAGAQTRLGGALSGVFMIAVLLVLGPIVDLTPIASLAGLLLVVAWDLVDFRRIRAIVLAGPTDAFAFVGTTLGTWALPLDQAIYLGVGISIILFLRNARTLTVREMVVDGDRLRELQPTEDHDQAGERFEAVKVLHVEGALFFGSANELRRAFDEALADDDVRVLVVRLKRAQGMDFTTAAVIEATHQRMRAQGQHLLLVGLRPRAMRVLEQMGIAEAMGPKALFPTKPGWFQAMDTALARARELVSPKDGALGGGVLGSYVDHHPVEGSGG